MFKNFSVPPPSHFESFKFSFEIFFCELLTFVNCSHHVSLFNKKAKYEIKILKIGGRQIFMWVLYSNKYLRKKFQKNGIVLYLREEF